jgi:predicted lipoprotein with Yx(FWY)xxD motif
MFSIPRPVKLAGGLLAGTMILGACGAEGAPLTADADSGAAADRASTTVDGGTSSAATPAVGATIGSSSLGEILVGPNGLTLYGFTNDAEAASTCYGTCAEAWPPVLVGRDFALAPALDEGLFATTTREDGTFQLVAGKWPLYYFAGDAVPGDVNGQGSGDVWFTVAPDGALITDESSAAAQSSDDGTGDGIINSVSPIATASTDLGEILTDEGGLSLYGFTEDVDGEPSCSGACGDAWPPLLIGGPDLPSDLDPSVFSVVTRADGTFQLRAGPWPLYRFAGDAGPGDVNGQGSGEVWFLAAPDGSLLQGSAPSAASDGEGASSGY